jgi:hypothetical protein
MLASVGRLIDPMGTRFLVYLDQCVLSRFPQNDAGWREVRDLLVRGAEGGRMFCPYSLEHLFETAAMPHEAAVALDLTLRQLSAGWSLRVEPELVAAQINQRIREQVRDRTYALERIPFKPLSDFKTYSVLRERKAAVDRYNEREMAPQNKLNEIFRDGPRANRSVLLALAHLKNESYARRFLSDLGPSLRDGRAHVVSRKDAPDTQAPFSRITALLVERHGFGVQELQALAALLCKNGVVFLPFFCAKVGLEAWHLWKQKDRDPGDQYDVTRLACALPIADMVVTDGSAASAVREVRLDELFGVRVFSTRDAERKDIVQALGAALA